MLTLVNMYHPITATPFCNNESYREIPPCDALKPYIRCFWGDTKPMTSRPNDGTIGLIIPDTCMDIIFDVNYTQNICTGIFCALDEHSYQITNRPQNEELTASFAIRFYAWSAIAFTEQDLRGSKNRTFQVEHFFERLKRELGPLLFDAPSLQEKAKIAEIFLLKHLTPNRIKSDFLNAVYYILSNEGRAKISDVCSYALLSEKQLERSFQYHMGISPKTFSSLVRYQFLWQGMVLSPKFNTLDAVEKYGYTDQSHLLRDFKNRHLITPTDAIIMAHNSR